MFVYISRADPYLQCFSPSMSDVYHVTFESLCFLLPQLLGGIWNWCLYGALVVQFCESYLSLT